jgi:hypothetical protein
MSTGRRRPDDRDVSVFLPRITLVLIGGFVLFMLIAGLYVLPVLLETPPPGAIPDYTKERVMARLEGKVLWMLATSLLVVAGLAIRGVLPGTGGRR